jgi:nucleoside-diphosphate-sugar epimerase
MLLTSSVILPEYDLEHVLAHTGGIWEEFASASLFITGGTGFFGQWLLESFIAANARHGLKARAVVLTRDAEGFARRAPRLASNRAISFHAGDIRDFEFPSGRFSHVIHAATPASAALNNERPLEMLDTIVQGTRRVLEFMQHCGAKKFLLCSSGAVYGRQPPELEHVPEDYTGGPDCLDPRSAYAEGKRTAELLSVAYAGTNGIQAKIARCFAFLGPHLPLDTHFAAGNFLRDAMSGQPICIQGDGTPYRSYLYAADLMIWLWTILAKGESCRAYNVGSEVATNIAGLATAMVDVVAPGTPVQVKGAPVHGKLPERYVPSTARARRELNLEQYIDLAETIRRTAEWYRQPPE